MKNIKVVFFGRGETGKSSLIARIIPEALNIEYKGMTVAMDFGHTVYKDINFNLFGTPGQDRWEKIREIVAHGVHIGVMVLDGSSDPTDEDKKIMEEIKKYNVPYIIFVNKRDIAVDNIKDTMEISKKFFPVELRVPLLFGSAEDGRNVDKLLDILVTIANTLSV
jgi:uncharacterized protein